LPWDDAAVRTYVLAQLGHPRRKVEVDELQVDQAIKRAVGYYGSKKPVIKNSFINIVNGQQGYNLETLGKPYGAGLIAVYFEPIESPQRVFNEFEYYRLRQPPYVELSEIASDTLYYGTANYLTGTDLDWSWHQDITTLLIKPAPNRSMKVAYDYAELPDSIENVPLYDQGWVVDYSLALVKEMLGRVRNKFQGVPGNELPIETDGADLISEGKEEQEALKEGLAATIGDRIPPIRG